MAEYKIQNNGYAEAYGYKIIYFVESNTNAPIYFIFESSNPYRMYVLKSLSDPFLPENISENFLGSKTYGK